MASAEQTQIHVWSPNLLGLKGGIQVYSSFFLKALEQFDPAIRYNVFIKHDGNGANPSPSLAGASHTKLHSTGAWPLSLRTQAFASQIVGCGLLNRPALILTTHLNFTRAAYWLKRMAGIPYWAVAHGIEAWDIQQPSLQQAVRQATRILAVSHYTRDRLLAGLNLDADKISVLPNTFDSQSFDLGPKPEYLLQRYNLAKGQPVLLTVSRLEASEKYKGYDKILLGLPDILKDIPDLRYIIVGRGDDQPRVQQLVAELRLQDAVTLAGYVPETELRDHYNLCDVFAMPSQGEGFGIVYLEALACGKPTLAGNKDGSVDALCHGELGALVDPDDVKQIAQTLMQILQRTYTHPLMYYPAALRQRVIEVYGFDRFKQTLSSYLQQFFSANGQAKL